MLHTILVFKEVRVKRKSNKSNRSPNEMPVAKLSAKVFLLEFAVVYARQTPHVEVGKTVSILAALRRSLTLSPLSSRRSHLPQAVEL